MTLSPKTPRSCFPCQETREIPGRGRFVSLGPQMKMSWGRVAPSPLRNPGTSVPRVFPKSILTGTWAGGRG